MCKILLVSLLASCAAHAALINYSLTPVSGVVPMQGWPAGVIYDYSGASGSFELSGATTPVTVGTLRAAIGPQINYGFVFQTIAIPFNIDGATGSFTADFRFNYYTRIIARGSVDRWEYTANVAPVIVNGVEYAGSLAGVADNQVANPITLTAVPLASNPEPATFGLIGFALTGLTLRLRLRNRRASSGTANNTQFPASR